MPRTNAAKLAAKVQFIFQGTVQKCGAATMACVPISDRTLIVQVDRILLAPEAFAACLGREITVQLRSRRANIAEGQTWIFYANSWLFGDSIAVQAVVQQRVPPAQAEPAPSPPESLANHDLQACLATADAVICGRVTVVRLPQTTPPVVPDSPAVVQEGEGEIAPPCQPISEHDPAWREAVIEVEEVEKGSVEHEQVVVRFSSSDDVQWYRTPKFKVGQAGVFVLHHKHTQPAPAAGAALGISEPGEREEVYDALHAADYQPFQQLPIVLALLAKTNDVSVLRRTCPPSQNGKRYFAPP
jgi:hypothetical protein